MLNSEQHKRDDKRLAGQDKLRKNPCGHRHCRLCNGCLIQRKHICIPLKEYCRLIRTFNFMSHTKGCHVS